MKPILLIVPFIRILEIAIQATQNMPYVQVECALLEDAIPLSLEAESKGTQVVISRGGSSLLLKSSRLNIPVVDITLSPFSLIRTIQKAKKISRKITVVSPAIIASVFEELSNLLDVEIEIHEIQNRNQAEKYVRQRMQSGPPIEVLLGGGIAEALAHEHGLPTVFLETNRQDIEKAVKEAVRLMEVRRKEAQKTEQLKAILDNINQGVIAVDRNEVITIFNKAAGKITGLAPKKAEGKKLSQMAPGDSLKDVIKTGRSQLGQLMLFEQKNAIANKVPVKIGKRIFGAVETLEDVTKIVEYEKIIRAKMAEKGYTAKFSFEKIIGQSPSIQKTIELAKKYANVDSTILIEGESGTGKEVFAQAIHSAGSRSKGPFVAVNCGALPDSLLESELFGYRPGTFSGALREGKEGLFTQAHNGTIFLDEIGSITQAFQITLLRVIQEMEVRPLGSNKVIPIDVRSIAATNKTLKQEVENGNFRSDLFYRLNILRINIPSLRFRKDDIPSLLNHFIQQNAAKLGKVISISQKATTVLNEYSWPGNIRELMNITERLCVTCDQKIDQELVQSTADEFFQNTSVSPKSIDGIKLSHIHEVLQQCQNNKTKAAEELGISRTTLWRELKRTT